MITKKHRIHIAIGVCILGLSVLGSQKHPVERPFKNHGLGTMVIRLSDGSFETTGVGNETHLGRTAIHMVGQQDPATFIVSWLRGTVTTANGDQLFVEQAEGGPPCFIGGTGRFEGASGTATTTEMEVLEVITEGDYMSVTVRARGEGTIIY